MHVVNANKTRLYRADFRGAGIYGDRLGWQVFLFLVIFATSACTPRPFPSIPPSATVIPPQTITVMAAASLSASFQEIGAQFESQHPGVKVQFNFAGSQQLSQQIAQGAPADVFASANNAQMDAIITTGRIEAGVAQTFAQNRLVVIYPKANPARITSLQDLARPGIKIDLAAKEVPVGQYTMEFLDKAARDPAFGAAFKADVIQNVVSYENNVKAVLTKIVLNEADAGVVYATDAAAAPADSVGPLQIPDAYNIIASYPIAMIKDSKNPDLAQAFVDFVLAPQGQAILAKYGFIQP